MGGGIAYSPTEGTQSCLTVHHSNCKQGNMENSLGLKRREKNVFVLLIIPFYCAMKSDTVQEKHDNTH